MPRHNPYHYSFNSPLVWKDPSGLAPEKEQDRLMSTLYDITKIAHDAYNEVILENGKSASMYTPSARFYGMPGSHYEAHISIYGICESTKLAQEGRLGSGGSGENGEVSYYNQGVDGNGDYHGILIIDLPSDNILIDIIIKNNAMVEGKTVNEMFQKLTDEYQKILYLDKNFFDTLFGGDFLINIWTPDDITTYYNWVTYSSAPLVIGLCSGTYDRSRTAIFFYSSALFGDEKYLSHSYKTTNFFGNLKNKPFELWEVVAHETVHYIDFLEQGFVRYYFLWLPLDREHSTINRLNKLRLKTNRPQEVLPWK